MIGIDITKKSRFSQPLEKYNERFGTTFTSIAEVAKLWACYEAIIKAEGKYFDVKDISIQFPYNQSPQIIDIKKVLKGRYCLSLSHEDDILVAVALFQGPHND